MPAGILRRGRIARASPMDEVGSMPTSSIKIERAVNCRLRTYWNYVGRHGLLTQELSILLAQKVKFGLRQVKYAAYAASEV